MFKNNNWLVAAVIAVLGNGLYALFLFYSGSSFLDLMLITGTLSGLILGLAIKALLGYRNPSDSLFQKRYALEGMAMGLFFASVIFVLSFIDNNTFGAMDVVFPLVFGTLFGVTWTNSAKHKKTKKRFNNFAEWNSGAIICSDMGSMTDANHSERKGFIMLTTDSVIFDADDADDQKIKTNLSETDPQLKKSWSGFFKIPTGIQLTKNQSIEPDKFPRYWLQKIQSLQSVPRRSHT